VVGAEDGEEGSAEPTGPAVEQLTPSSFGFSFSVEPEVEELEVAAAWGTYSRGPSETLTSEAGNPVLVWKREPAGGTLTLDLSAGQIEPVAPDSSRPDVVVRGRVRDHDGQRLVTLFLVNDQEEPEQRKDEAWLFQAELRVREPSDAPVFVRRRPAQAEVPAVDREEQRRLDMLYRENVEFASGHGVAVAAEVSADDPTRSGVEDRRCPRLRGAADGRAERR
jgi:hypothetical protein